jgi:PAB-dependent poly(A)-specific ribonuclease subunit 3
LTNEKAIRAVKEWRQIDSGGVVSIIDAFTTRAFNDSSLIFVTDYYPLSKTLAETHFVNTGRYGSRTSSTVQEPVLWTYMVQIASAMKMVHAVNLAVRCLEPSKIILTDKNRVRFSACSVLDVVQYDAQRPVQELQQEDLYQFGKLMLSIATNSLNSHLNMKGAMEQLSRSYSVELTQTVSWLLAPAQSPMTKTVDDLLRGISGHVMESLDKALHAEDSIKSEMSKELENGRITRLMAKLNCIIERPEYEHSSMYAENEKQYILKLFRDYVFHQVDSNGDPVTDLGHIISCLNKLDAGSEEKIMLMSRDEQSVFVTSYKDLKKAVATAFGDLQQKSGKQRGY